jgi:hypothetical protein
MGQVTYQFFCGVAPPYIAKELIRHQHHCKNLKISKKE